MHFNMMMKIHHYIIKRIRMISIMSRRRGDTLDTIVDSVGALQWTRMNVETLLDRISVEFTDIS